MAGIHPYLDRPGPLALAHRGFSRTGLENSMAAFAAAVELAYDYVETDVHATADGVAVALHDATLDRVTDRTGAVAELPWSEVRRALIGGVEPVPALEDVLGSWPSLRVNIDVKSAGAVAPLARVLDRTRAHDRVCVASFSDARRRAVLRRLAAPVASSAGQTLIATFVAAASMPGLRGFAGSVLRGVDCLQVPATFRGIEVVTPATVAAAHAAGRPVHVWTVNEPAEMRRLLDLGVDGLITDRADLLREVLESRGQWNPAA
ncbi:glycerophosphodiester phosphodiesterase family protein [Jiangella alba]|uniref:Glycerophosphoryl diester phosphodiesterase n=1 Tax=Jiangella alba TaxID=561176 RepID=A0A1H5M318_9ACTN|nr:glycerophosphodiester phosphodiesterase family protein [Jiangella alba]SEE83686.1 glycerophosphoryl diester phosphodiesterase [Jiangella alba]